MARALIEVETTTISKKPRQCSGGAWLGTLLRRSTGIASRLLSWPAVRTAPQVDRGGPAQTAPRQRVGEGRVRPERRAWGSFWTTHVNQSQL